VLVGKQVSLLFQQHILLLDFTKKNLHANALCESKCWKVLIKNQMNLKI